MSTLPTALPLHLPFPWGGETRPGLDQPTQEEECGQGTAIRPGWTPGFVCDKGSRCGSTRVLSTCQLPFCSVIFTKPQNLHTRQMSLLSHSLTRTLRHRGTLLDNLAKDKGHNWIQTQVSWPRIHALNTPCNASLHSLF